VVELEVELLYASPLLLVGCSHGAFPAQRTAGGLAGLLHRGVCL